MFYQLQACNQLELATHIEMLASLLRLNAIKTMKSILAGTAANKLQDVLEAAFGGEDEDDEDYIPEDQPEDEPSTSQGESSTAMKQKAPPTTSASKHKTGHKGGICALSDASCYYPTTSDAKSSAYLHGGVDPSFYSSHISSWKMRSAGYECMYSSVKKAEGVEVPDCDFFSTMKGQLSTHIRQFHLNIAIACFICPLKRWWSGSSWMDHMKKYHMELDPDCFFVREGVDIEEFKSSFTIKQEVTGDDI